MTHPNNTGLCHCDDDRICPACLMEERIANPTDAEVKAMLDWALDCEWEEGPEYIESLTRDEIIASTQRHYDGGLRQFFRDQA